MALRRWLAAAALGAALTASTAAACPACAGRDDDQNRTAYFVGAMILVPWTISIAVVFAIRKLQQGESQT